MLLEKTRSQTRQSLRNQRRYQGLRSTRDPPNEIERSYSFPILPIGIFVQRSEEVNLKKILDAAYLRAANNEYHVNEVMGCLVKKGKVTYFVKWRWFLAKKDWTHENYESFD
jgi:hypothetical protein